MGLPDLILESLLMVCPSVFCAMGRVVSLGIRMRAWYFACARSQSQAVCFRVWWPSISHACVVWGAAAWGGRGVSWLGRLAHHSADACESLWHAALSLREVDVPEPTHVARRVRGRRPRAPLYRSRISPPGTPETLAVAGLGP